MKQILFLKVFLSLLLLSFISNESAAQFFLRGGYSLGLCNPKEINRVIYIHNQINSTWYVSGNDLAKVKSLGGIHIAMGSELDENAGFEFSWSNKHQVSKADFIFNGETINRFLKVRTNNIGLGLYGGNSAIAIGGTLDFGNMKGFYKRVPEDSLKDAAYISVFQNNNDYFGTSDEADHDLFRTLQMGLTPFIQLKFGPAGLRLFYQWQFLKLDLDNIDNKLLGDDIEEYSVLSDKLNNAGLLLFIQFGGYR